MKITLNPREKALLKRAKSLVDGALILQSYMPLSEEQVCLEMIKANLIKSDSKTHLVTKVARIVKDASNKKAEKSLYDINDNRLNGFFQSQDWEPFIENLRLVIKACNSDVSVTSVAEMIQHFAKDMAKKEAGEWPIPAKDSWSIKYQMQYQHEHS